MIHATLDRGSFYSVTDPITYKLKDLNGEEIVSTKGSFYGEG